MISTALYNEIAHTRMFEMQESAFFNHARMFLSHYRSLTEEDKASAKLKSHLVLKASTRFLQAENWDDTQGKGNASSLDQEEAFINIISFSGPMMRHGGACAYGSIELREMIMRAADMPNCIGHIFIVDTPGGSSSTKDDLAEAMEYAHSKGQETAMQVDGILMSAGMAWGAKCKKRYARNAHNLFGCMGTYASFYTNKNMDVNTVTQEMFHVVYADSSPDKNKPWRDAAEGNQQSVLDMVNRENERYLSIIKAGIPNVTEEQLKGGEWEAQDVIGTLCDGIRSLDEIVAEMVETKGLRMEEPLDPKTPGNPEEPVDPNEPEEPENSQETITNQHSTSMGKSYDKIKAALNWPTLESGKDNSLWLHEEYADALTAFVENAERVQNALEAKQEDVNNLVNELTQLKADNVGAIEAAKKEAEEAAGKSLEQFNTDKKVLEERIASLEAENTKLKETIEEKDNTIKELSEEPGELNQPSVVQTKQTAEEKPLLASEYKGRKQAKEAHANLMQQLRDRM